MNDKMKPYPEYKDSGVPWLGKIPAHWNISTFRTLATPIKGRQPNQLYTTQEKDTDDLPYLSMDYIRNTHPEFPKYAKKSPHTVLAAKGDILLLWDGANASEFFQAKSGIVSSTTALIKPKIILDKTFFYYASKIAEPYLRSQTTGMGIPHVDGTVLKHLRYGICPLEEQQAIARFLDEHDRVTRRYIRAQQRLIKLLTEQKQALIQQAVTRGLDPDVPLKDSRIEWLGKIPEHWDIVKLSYISQVLNGSTPSRMQPQYWTNGTIPWISSGKVNDYIVKEPSELISEQAFKDTSLTLIPRGSVIIGLIGQGRTRGMSAFLDIATCINQNLAAIEPKQELDGHFLHYALTSSYKAIRQYARGGNQGALNCEIVSSFRIQLPSLEEQKRIVSHLDKALYKILILERDIHRQISLIREYRTRLIADVVTGKLDVRGL